MVEEPESSDEPAADTYEPTDVLEPAARRSPSLPLLSVTTVGRDFLGAATALIPGGDERIA